MTDSPGQETRPRFARALGRLRSTGHPRRWAAIGGGAAVVASGTYVLLDDLSLHGFHVLMPLSTGLAAALALFVIVRGRKIAQPVAGNTGNRGGAEDAVGSEVILWLQRRLGGELREAVERALPSVLTRVRDQIGTGPRSGGASHALGADRSMQVLQRRLGTEVRTAVRQAFADGSRRSEPGDTLSVPMTIQVMPSGLPPELIPAPRGGEQPGSGQPGSGQPASSGGDARTGPQNGGNQNDGNPAAELAVETLDPADDEPADELTAYRMRIHLQPIHDADGALVGADTLLRWEHPERGVVMPNEMLPRFALQGRLQSLFSSQLITTGRIWKQLEKVRPGLMLVVRADLTASADDDRLKCLRMALSLGGIDPGRLHWDVAARQALAMPTQFREWAQRCHQHGFPVLLSGWPAEAPLDRAVRMQVDGVRIDGRDGGASRLRPRNIERAREAGLQITATGLEDEAAVQQARAAGVELLMGYGLGAPVLAGEFVDRLDDEPGPHQAPEGAGSPVLPVRAQEFDDALR